ncbi:hypothetical protein [Dactylosporangium fulvum]|uniref:Uncharacterized protein n=1 Tax=Dactylosporangium fulvum TaxID=53359 RepID=A0ABY5WA50_9ACTN|nr:hypothetical protein [Dactylosporangium fulvum]UWP85981.1 hypothetical protein Dfulv_17690 [Dactylosporangium fulvum]
MDAALAGRGYLEHLTDEDLRLLARSVGADPVRARELRGRPAELVEHFRDPRLFRSVFGGDPAGLVNVSPFFAFLVAVEQAAREISGARFVTERAALRQVVPVFDAPRLGQFLDDPMLRLFLAELLTSFVRVASGRYWIRTARGLRSQRFSELDPVRLAVLAEQAPAAAKPGVYRRLGDVSLFLTGVFPDYTQLHAFGPVDAGRLLRAAGLSAKDTEWMVAPAIELLEHLGRRWYRHAVELAPVTTVQLEVVALVAERFQDVRRILNHVTDRYLDPAGNPWFGTSG